MNLSFEIGHWIGSCCGCTRITAFNDKNVEIPEDIKEIRKAIQEAMQAAKRYNYVIVLTATDSKKHSKFEEALGLEGFEVLDKSGSKTIWYKPTIGSSL